MIAKAKVISHGANAIRYSVDKDKAEIVKTNLLPNDIAPTAMWARMLALQKRFEDKLNRHHPLKRNMIRMEVSPTTEETQGWEMKDWQKLADDFIRELTFLLSQNAKAQWQPISKTANMWLLYTMTARAVSCTFILMRTA